MKDEAMNRLSQIPQTTRLKTSLPAAPYSSFPSVPVVQATNPASLTSIKVTYRPVLTDVVQTQHVRDLCKRLVVVAAEAAKTYSDRKVQEKLDVNDDNSENSVASLNPNGYLRPKEHVVQQAPTNSLPTAITEEKLSAEESGSDNADEQKAGRPMSPGTLELMCDEQDTLFMTCRNSDGVSTSCDNNSMSEIYEEQERCVLMEFRECLRKLVTQGFMKGERYASMANKCEASGSQPPILNDVARAPNLVAVELPQSTKPMPVISNKHSATMLLRNGDLKTKTESPQR